MIRLFKEWTYIDIFDAHITVEHAEPRLGGHDDRAIQSVVSESSLNIFFHILTLSICHSEACCRRNDKFQV